MSRSQESTLEENLTPGVLRELAGARYFERGEDYHHRGLARALVEHEGTVAAKVLGTHEYRVRLWADGDELRHSCDCPLGMAGEFCKHCVAVGLSRLGGGMGEDLREEIVVTMDDVRKYLEGQTKEALVGIILEQTMEDERLLWRAARTGSGPPDIAAFRRAIDSAVETADDYWDYGSYARGLGNVVESISVVLKEGFAAEAMELSEYALAAVEDRERWATTLTVLSTASSKAWRRSTTHPAWKRGRTPEH